MVSDDDPRAGFNGEIAFFKEARCFLPNSNVDIAVDINCAGPNLIANWAAYNSVDGFHFAIDFYQNWFALLPDICWIWKGWE